MTLLGWRLIRLPQINPKEVWKAWVAYEDNPDEGKVRPVLVLDVDGKYARVLSVPITSTDPRDEYDIEVFDWADIPLDHESTARASKTIDIPMNGFYSKIGKVSDDDWDNITDLYGEYLKSNS